jgi:hypothetical protein
MYLHNSNDPRCLGHKGWQALSLPALVESGLASARPTSNRAAVSCSSETSRMEHLSAWHSRVIIPYHTVPAPAGLCVPPHQLAQLEQIISALAAMPTVTHQLHDSTPANTARTHCSTGGCDTLFWTPSPHSILLSLHCAWSSTCLMCHATTVMSLSLCLLEMVAHPVCHHVDNHNRRRSQLAITQIAARMWSVVLCTHPCCRKSCCPTAIIIEQNACAHAPGTAGICSCITW